MMRTLILTIACMASFQIALDHEAKAQYSGNQYSGNQYSGNQYSGNQCSSGHCSNGQCAGNKCAGGHCAGALRGMFTGVPPVSHPWHGGYYHQSWGQPLAVVVPPTANNQQSYSWGVGQNLMYPINSQYGRNAPGGGAAAQGSFRPTPAWPSHTDQFGYYYIRAPW